jgi:hypothetical protein
MNVVPFSQIVQNVSQLIEHINSMEERVIKIEEGPHGPTDPEGDKG